MKSFKSYVSPLALLIFAFSGASAIAKDAQRPSPWDPILSVLNVSPTNNPDYKAAYADPVTLDLLKANAEELRTLEDRWQQEKAKVPKTNAKDERRLKNIFFHEQVSRSNEAIFAKLADSTQRSQTEKKDYRLLAKRVLAQVHKNPVAKLESVQAFDQGGQIGFCFGRALLVHYLLLKAGVPQADLAKIFVLGQLLVAKQTWNFHVAVMVKDTAAGFLVIDPLQKDPMDYRKWVELNARYEIKGSLSRARFYVSDPRKFLPSFGIYHKDQLEDPVLKDYFAQLAGTL